MFTFFEEKTSSIMGNGPSNDEKPINDEYKPRRNSIIHRKQNGLIFFAGTDKASVISEILEERGWSRTRDHSVTNFTIKWCLAHQVDWNQFQAGKQLINNIPGQITFSDKINLWNTVRDYLAHRHSLDGNHIQTFLPMTFVLDDEREIAAFLRSYKKHTRTWICKPRYNFAGRGIYILSGSSELNTIFKFKVGANNRLQYEPRFPGYLMQEYIARPLLIKNRKFDIRVHWLVAWTKPLVVFYNHKASVVRLSLNLYREFDLDRATHLTNLSVQENHCRYASDQESTGMTMNQLNHYFNQCFRPFYPKMCQDWVMTVMQERMQTIIRHVIRASKDKLTREAGQFGLYGCDFLLDENFRIWLLEINDNPGVGWGNARLNTSTKPLFEETLNIVFECFEKYNKNQTILPVQCLQNYELIYDEDNDTERLLRDDNQIFTERLSIRYAKRDVVSRATHRRLLSRVNTSRSSLHQFESSTNTPTSVDASIKVDDLILPLINVANNESPEIETPTFNFSSMHPILINPPIRATTPAFVDPKPSIIHATPVSFSTATSTPFSSITLDQAVYTSETFESLKHDDDIALERLMKPSPPIILTKEPIIISKPQPSASTTSSVTRPIIKINKTSIKRTLSVTNNVRFQRKKRIDITPVVIYNRRYIHRHGLTPPCTETIKNKALPSANKDLLDHVQEEKILPQTDQSVPIASIDLPSPELLSIV